MSYVCLSKSEFKDSASYSLISLRQEDIEAIRGWRNDQIDVLRQSEMITSEQQRNYFETMIFTSFNQKCPSQLLFSFLLDGICIGYGGLTRMNWQASHAEVSFLVDSNRVNDEKLYSKDLSHFLSLLCEVAFQELGLHRLLTETFCYRTAHIAILERFGFIQEGQLREHIYKRNRWHDSLIHGLLKREWNREL